MSDRKELKVTIHDDGTMTVEPDDETKAQLEALCGGDHTVDLALDCAIIPIKRPCGKFPE